MALLLRALVGGNDGIETFRRNEGQDALIQQLQAAKRGLTILRAMKILNPAIRAAHRFGTGGIREPARGQRAFLVPNAEQRPGGDVGHNIRVEQPARFIQKPARVAQRAAGAQDGGLEHCSNAQLRERLAGEIVQDGAGRMMQIDEHLLDAPIGEHRERSREHGAIPKRQHGLGRCKGQRA